MGVVDSTLATVDALSSYDQSFQRDVIHIQLCLVLGVSFTPESTGQMLLRLSGSLAPSAVLGVILLRPSVLSGASNAIKSGQGLTVSKTPIKGMGTAKARLNFRGQKNAVIRGGNVGRGANAGTKRAFVTDSKGRIVKEITTDRVKIRQPNPGPGGWVFEGFVKVKGKPSSSDLDILKMLD